MDNCSVHHVEKVKQLFKDAGILLLFLLSLHPGLNIKETWRPISENMELLQAIPNPMDVIQAALLYYNVVRLQEMYFMESVISIYIG